MQYSEEMRIAFEEEAARRFFCDFASYLYPNLEITPFHDVYYKILGMFAKGKIRKLIVTVPPQHGKSLGSSILLPAYLLGINPDLQICIASYNQRHANKFNKRVQRIITSPQYQNLFGETKLKSLVKGMSTRKYEETTTLAEIVNHDGSLRSAGRNGTITGNAVDILIVDDLYKNDQEANSPIVREETQEWYFGTAVTRLHNKSQELIVFTRWHDEDLIGHIERKEDVITLLDLEQIDPDFRGWYKINFPALQNTTPSPIDPRKLGEALWPTRQSAELLQRKRGLDELAFECMYQGSPMAKEGLLYTLPFLTYTELPQNIVKRYNYTDTADTGDDYLCSICYSVDREGFIYITDVVYSKEPMEVTEGLVANAFRDNNTQFAYIESNNGGRGFARSIQRMVPTTRVDWFHQSGNKEARIVNNASTVQQWIKMPEDWARRWPAFYMDIIKFRRKFNANKHDDAPDAVTGIIEKEVQQLRRGSKFSTTK